VRTEIQEHFDAEREAAMNGGATGAEADRIAIAAVGDAKTVNCQYRNVLLTSAEERVLRDANWEARAICSRYWLKLLLRGVPATALIAAAALFFGGQSEAARILFAAGIGCGVMFLAPYLPIYTPSRGRVFRRIKWAVLVCALLAAFGPDAAKFSWLMLSCLWPLVWIEWTRASIRRKLRVAEWPKQLYL